MADVCTHGIRTVKPGREEELLAAWRALARGARFETFTLDEVDLDD